MSQHTILYIEDDFKLAQLVSNYLSSHGYTLDHFDSGCHACYQASSKKYDLILLDVGLGSEDGFEVFKELKQYQDTPIIFMTARQSQVDHITGLELGADDYLTKPVSPSILLARINNTIRRSQAVKPISNTHNAYNIRFGSLSINTIQREAYLHSQPLELTSAEFEILVQLTKSPGQLVSRDQLFDGTIGRKYDGQSRTIDGRISRLRKKLGDEAVPAQKIVTVWGKGYIFSPQAWG
ncbi:response regulator transcription factor [Pseudoalteromonas sp.]|uniref:response regulator transcription factor n=1 Tax=Pseudoalteromonas sp. TaxID=53249 RepID=UPI0025EC8778|nr:response regulator transcription factor [Pseudoalteromonas sp.]